MVKKIDITLAPPGYDLGDWVALPRQKRWQILRQAAGICVSCGQEEITGKSKRLCADCARKQRERMRQRTGATRRNIKSRSYSD